MNTGMCNPEHQIKRSIRNMRRCQAGLKAEIDGVSERRADFFAGRLQFDPVALRLAKRNCGDRGDDRTGMKEGASVEDPGIARSECGAGTLK